MEGNLITKLGLGWETSPDNYRGYPLIYEASKIGTQYVIS